MRLLLCLLLLTGCATWRKHGIDLGAESRLRLRLEPVTCSVKADDPVRVSSEVYAILDAELRKYPWFELADSTASAQAVLRVDVGGWGKIKRKWLWWLVGSGVVEGGVEGGLLAPVAGPWAAVGIAAEEVAQEGLTWGGGVYLFNRVFTPVILDVRLVSLADGKTAWSDTAFARRNRKALKKLPKERRKDKELRLRLTAQLAAEDLVESLSKAALRNIRAQSK